MEFILLLVGFIVGLAFSRLYWRKEIYSGTMLGDIEEGSIYFKR